MACASPNCGCGGDEKAPHATPRPTLLGPLAGPQLRAVGMAAAKAAASNGRHALVEAGQRPVQIGPVARVVPGASRQRPHVLANRPDLRSPFGVEPLVVQRAKSDGGEGADARPAEVEALKAAVGPDVAPFRGPRHTLVARPSALDPFGVEALIARNTATKSAGPARPQSVGRATLAAATSVKRGPSLPASQGPRPHQLARRPGGWDSLGGMSPAELERAISQTRDHRRKLATAPEEVTILDVRTEAEFAAGHVEGAINTPNGIGASVLARLGPKTGKIVVYCQTGRRSGAAVAELARLGFRNVVDGASRAAAARLAGRPVVDVTTEHRLRREPRSRLAARLGGPEPWTAEGESADLARLRSGWETGDSSPAGGDELCLYDPRLCGRHPAVPPPDGRVVTPAGLGPCKSLVIGASATDVSCDSVVIPSALGNWTPGQLPASGWTEIPIDIGTFNRPLDAGRGYPPKYSFADMQRGVPIIGGGGMVEDVGGRPTMIVGAEYPLRLRTHDGATFADGGTTTPVPHVGFFAIRLGDILRRIALASGCVHWIDGVAHRGRRGERCDLPVAVPDAVGELPAERQRTYDFQLPRGARLLVSIEVAVGQEGAMPALDARARFDHADVVAGANVPADGVFVGVGWGYAEMRNYFLGADWLVPQQIFGDVFCIGGGASAAYLALAPGSAFVGPTPVMAAGGPPTFVCEGTIKKILTDEERRRYASHSPTYSPVNSVHRPFVLADSHIGAIESAELARTRQYRPDFMGPEQRLSNSLTLTARTGKTRRFCRRFRFDIEFLAPVGIDELHEFVTPPASAYTFRYFPYRTTATLVLETTRLSHHAPPSRSVEFVTHEFSRNAIPLADPLHGPPVSGLWGAHGTGDAAVFIGGMQQDGDPSGLLAVHVECVAARYVVPPP